MAVFTALLLPSAEAHAHYLPREDPVWLTDALSVTSATCFENQEINNAGGPVPQYVDFKSCEGRYGTDLSGARTVSCFSRSIHYHNPAPPDYSVRKWGCSFFIYFSPAFIGGQPITHCLRTLAISGRDGFPPDSTEDSGGWVPYDCRWDTVLPFEGDVGPKCAAAKYTVKKAKKRLKEADTREEKKKAIKALKKAKKKRAKACGWAVPAGR